LLHVDYLKTTQIL